MADVEQLRRVKIIAPGAVPAPRLGHWFAFSGDVIEVSDAIANALIRQGSAETVPADTPLVESI